MKKTHFIIKTVWQILLYSLELISISLLLTWLSSFINNLKSVWDCIERFIACYTIYQLLIIIILNNINDIDKDSCLAYITNLKKTLLYIESKNKSIKQEILNNIDYQLDKGTVNNSNYREAYLILKRNIDNIENIDKSFIECELINAEHNYELVSLNWRYSFLLRLFK